MKARLLLLRLVFPSLLVYPLGNSVCVYLLIVKLCLNNSYNIYIDSPDAISDSSSLLFTTSSASVYIRISSQFSH